MLLNDWCNQCGGYGFIQGERIPHLNEEAYSEYPCTFCQQEGTIEFDVDLMKLYINRFLEIDYIDDISEIEVWLKRLNLRLETVDKTRYNDLPDTLPKALRWRILSLYLGEVL